MNRNSTVLIYNDNEKEESNRTLKEDKSENKEKKEINKVEMKELKLKLRKKVAWTEDTIDNEHMNKKKSKSKHS